MEKNITISMEEYKELLVIKGKYEELKDCYITNKLNEHKSNTLIREPFPNLDGITITC